MMKVHVLLSWVLRSIAKYVNLSPLPEALREPDQSRESNPGGTLHQLHGNSLSLVVPGLDVEIDGAVAGAVIEWEGDGFVDGAAYDGWRKLFFD